MREQTQRISEFRQEHRGALPDELQTSLRRIEMLNSRRESLTSQIGSTETRIMTMGGGQNHLELGELRRQFARDSAIYTEEHPNIVALRWRIDRLERVIRAEAKHTTSDLPEYSGEVASGRSEVSRLRAQIYGIDKEITEINARVDRIPAVAEQLAALEQKALVLRERRVCGESRN